MAPPSVVATVSLSTAATTALRSEHPLVSCQAKGNVEGESEIEELKLPLRIPLARATDAPREMEERRSAGRAQLPFTAFRGDNWQGKPARMRARRRLDYFGVSMPRGETAAQSFFVVATHSASLAARQAVRGKSYANMLVQVCMYFESCTHNTARLPSSARTHISTLSCFRMARAAKHGSQDSPRRAT